MSEGSPLRVVIAGGSIGGLGAAIALRDIGADVRVLERQVGPMDTRGAGIVVQSELTSLLRRHDAPALAMTGCRFRRYLQPHGGEGSVQPARQQFTSWEAIYVTLRQAFGDDGYLPGMPISGFEQADGIVSVAIEDGAQMTADLLVCADGANSWSRRHLLPDVEPSYAGYVAWRGTLDEADAPGVLRSFFDDAFTFSEARSGGHILAYFIPGDGADSTVGRRRLNWVWYVATDQGALDGVLVDRHGHRHHASLPQGLASDDAVAALQALASREVHPRLAELVQATPDPFLQTIVDVEVSRTLFGRVMLLGDAAFVIRPHTAAAAAKAAFDATTLAEALRRAGPDINAGLLTAEERQLERGRSLLSYGRSLGRRFARARD